MDLKRHEEWIRKEMENSTEKLDTNALWADVEKYVPTKKRNKRFGLLLLSLLFMAGACGLIYLSNSDTNQRELLIENQEFVEVNNKTRVNQEINSSEIKTGNNTIENKVTDNNYTKQHDAISRKNAINSSNNVLEHKIVSNFQQKDEGDIANNEKAVENESTFYENIPSTSSQTNTINQVTHPDAKNSSNRFPVKITENSTIASSNAYEADDTVRERDAVNTQGIKVVDISLIYANKDINSISTLPVITPKKVNNTSWYYGMRTGITMGSTRMTASGELYEETYNNITTIAPSFSAGIQIGYFIHRRWAVSGDVIYDRFVTRYRHSYEEREIANEYGIKQYVIGIDGQKNEEGGQVETFFVERTEGTWYTRQNQISLSIGANYTLIQKNRLRVVVGAGCSSRVWKKKEGSTLGERSESLIIEPIITQTTHPVDFLPYGTFAVLYKVNTRTSIGIDMRAMQFTDYTINQTREIRNTLFTIGLSGQYSF